MILRLPEMLPDLSFCFDFFVSLVSYTVLILKTAILTSSSSSLFFSFLKGAGLAANRAASRSRSAAATGNAVLTVGQQSYSDGIIRNNFSAPV